jgi:cobaltochelatase CobS
MKETQKMTNELHHRKYKEVKGIIEQQVPLLLVGPAGSGKNVVLEQVAKDLGKDFYFTNAVTEEYKLTGFIDASGTYQETQFYQAFTKGGIFFLDEMDASVPEALVILNAAIANRYFNFPNGKAQAHPDFTVVAAANTTGRGADQQYTGRHILDAATLDRFVLLDFNYDEELEKKLSDDTELVEFVQACRHVLADKEIDYPISMRAVVNGSKLEKVLNTLEIVNYVVLKGMTTSTKQLIAANLNDTENKYVNVLKMLFKE